MARGQGEREPAAKRIADKARLLDVQCIHKADQMLQPQVQVVDRTRLALRVSEARQIGRDHAEFLGQHGDGQSPVGIRRHAGAGAMHEDQWRPAARFEVVGLEAGSQD